MRELNQPYCSQPTLRAFHVSHFTYYIPRFAFHVFRLLLAAFCVMFWLSPAYADSSMFTFPSLLLDGNNAVSVAVGDLNGDGALDLVLGKGFDFRPHQMYLNDGRGNFATPTPLPGGGYGTFISVALGDLNGDGALDIVLGNSDQSSQVYLNDGRASFAAPRPLSGSGGDTRSVAVGDLNGDGALDLVLGNSGQFSQVYLNDGRGNFAAPKSLSGSGSDTRSVGVGDLNGDGALDLVFGNSGQSSQVYLNDGLGNFALPMPLPGSGRDTRSVVIGDLNGDGALDLVLGNQVQDSQVYLNDGLGNFALPTSLLPGNGNDTWSVAVGDLDGDGALDLVLGNSFIRPSQIYLNDGRGDFNTRIPTPIAGSGNGTRSVALGDLNGDGALDLVLANGFIWYSQVYQNNGQGSFAATAPLPGSGNGTRSVAVGDLNGDGALDLVLGNGFTWYSQMYLNDGHGNFATPASLPDSGNYTTSVAVGDLNGDGALDLVLGNYSSDSQVYLNDGRGNFVQPRFIPGSDNTDSVAVGDLNGDGAIDLVLDNQVYVNDGQANFATPKPIPGSGYTVNVAVGDLNSDGALDLVFGNQVELSQVYLNDGSGNFVETTPLPGSVGAISSVALGDLNGDGALDLVLGNWIKPGQVYLNNGQGSFAPPTSLPGTGVETTSVAVGDLNGDGALDLVLGNTIHPSQLYLNDGQGSFAAPTPLSGGGNGTRGVAAGDLNGDGALDLVLGNYGSDSQVYLNRLVNAARLPNNSPSIAVTRPGSTRNANFFSTPQIINGPTIPITYSLFDTEGESVGRIAAYYSLDGGGRWLPAVATTDTITTNLTTGRTVHTSRAYSPTQAIPDGPAGVMSATLPVSGTGTVADLEVLLSISHTRNSDLQVALVSPAGTHVLLFSNVGGNGAGFLGTVMDDQAATSIISGTAPFTGIYRPQGRLALFNSQTLSGTWHLVITDTVAGNTGSLIGWGLRIATPRITHVYNWDVFTSGVFGQSDNVVFRLEAHAQPAQSSITGTYSYPNAAAGPYQRPYAAATTFPFRVRGTQVRVVDESGQPIRGALVYRRPNGQLSGGLPMGGATTPFRTSLQGYLQGRGELHLGDQLVALWPISETSKYSLSLTSATPTPTGLNAFTVTQTGVQTLTVSAANPLLLFDLAVSLEWDASNDPGFLTQLEQNLAKTSQSLYDWSNGQVALGRVTVYQDKQRWDEADVRIFASNQVRPIANRGGIVTQTTVLSFTRPITFTSGEIRIGPTWNRYGDPQPIGADWPNVLAHELGHYALFLEDTYLGLDENSILIPVDTCANTAMSDPYSDSFSEFRYADDQWQQQCGQTLAELPDWDLIALAYPALHSPPPTNTGPSTMPFAFTRIEVAVAPGHPQSLLDDFNIPLNDASGALSNGRAYLRHPGERLVDLGQPVLNSVPARGAREGDELCVFGATAFACSLLSNSAPTHLITRTLWQPEIILTPISSTTLQILVNTTTTGALTATVYPNGEAPQVTVLTPTSATTVTLSQPAVEVLVDLAGSGPGERLITGYASGAGPGQQRGHGGPGQQRGHGGPFASGDGSVLIYPPKGLAEEVFIVLQTATSLPELPSALKPIGRAYHIRPSAVVTDFSGASVSFQYLGLDVLLADVSGTPQQKEASLAVHHWDGTTWTHLQTTLNPIQNFASAPLPAPGLYVLTAGRARPAIDTVSPTSGDSGRAHTLTILGENFLGPLAVTLKGQTGVTYPLTVGLVNSRMMMAMTPITLPADLYDLKLTNAGGLSVTLDSAFALYATQPEVCFFDDFASGWRKWTRTGEWDIVAVGGQEAATDSPGASYLNAEPGLTRITSITSQDFALPADSEPVLTFRHDYVIAKGSGHQDWGTVEISFDSGVTWLPLTSYTGGSGYSVSLTTLDEWSQISWKSVTINLAQSGMPTNATSARLRFNLVVDAMGSDKGWIVDDVSVTASGCPSRMYIYLPLITK